MEQRAHGPVEGVDPVAPGADGVGLGPDGGVGRGEQRAERVEESVEVGHGGGGGETPRSCPRAGGARGRLPLAEPRAVSGVGGGMADLNYHLIGKRVRVHLYTRAGQLLGAIEGRVADASGDVLVGTDAEGREIRKDLVYVLDIEPLKGPDGEDVPYTNSAGGENEGWFAVQDVTVVGDGPPLMAN